MKNTLITIYSRYLKGSQEYLCWKLVFLIAVLFYCRPAVPSISLTLFLLAAPADGVSLAPTPPSPTDPRLTFIEIGSVSARGLGAPGKGPGFCG
jgi:hypothetical protein